eukprot:COSAG02_NODE_3091_length_7386_cov_7.913682_3_plen_137_part_00
MLAVTLVPLVAVVLQAESRLSSPPSSALRLPSILATNMLLQRDSPASMWGWAPSGSVVSVTLDGTRPITTTATAAGTFSVMLPAQQAALNRTISVSMAGTDPIRLSNVAFGDLYFCSGAQSRICEAPSSLLRQMLV